MVNSSTILIAGATGTNGRLLTARLAAAGQTVRALVRNSQSAQSLAQPNVQLFEGDLNNPASLEAAFENVERAFIAMAIVPNTVELFQNFFEAAKNTTDVHIVKFSALGAGDKAKSVIQQQHTQSDNALMALGLPYTILRPNSFYQNMLWSAPSIQTTGQFYLPFGEAKQSLVDVRDLVEVAFQALMTTEHQGKVYELTGPEACSYYDVAQQLSTTIGKAVTYVPIPNEAALQGMLDSGMPEWTAKAIAELYSVFATGEFAQTNDTIQTITGKPATSFATWAAENKAAFAE
ncbi:SDR family oxidoreductase [Almyronema epifaneia]|uniref:SDR family oxidoreductase n=1 Tax=Almyronema epifaneia S1 TaxID=2991925 RepID=A0ABW6IIK0_9CYAN